jgi:hypothetical protein
MKEKNLLSAHQYLSKTKLKVNHYTLIVLFDEHGEQLLMTLDETKKQL